MPFLSWMLGHDKGEDEEPIEEEEIEEEQEYSPFEYEGRNFGIIEGSSLDTWEDLDGILDQGWELISVSNSGPTSWRLTFYLKRKQIQVKEEPKA